MATMFEAVGVGAAITAVGLSYTIHKLVERVDHLERSVIAVFNYAKEFDPRHDEERWLEKDILDGNAGLSGLHHFELTRAKRARGERTLNDPIFRPGDR